MGKNRTQKKGKLTNNGVVAGRIEPIKNADYSDVIMGVSGVFNPKTQLNDALIAYRTAWHYEPVTKFGPTE